MDNIRFIKPTDLHAEMLRLRQERQMDFLECLTGMDWGETTDKDTPDTPRGLGVVYHLESTTTGRTFSRTYRYLGPRECRVTQCQ